jgi:hypothetical protein
VVLEDALLGDRVWAYSWYRLRFFFVRYVVASAIHTVKVLLLFQIFSLRSFTTILLVQVAAGLVGSFWWGSLEVLRGGVRDLLRTSQPHRIPAQVNRWMTFAVQLSALTLLAGLGWVGWRAMHAGHFGPVDLYLVSVVLRLGLELTIRCYHSGIYALRRIYRPFAAILGLELVSFAGILCLWPFVGPWALPIGALLSTVVGAMLTARYTARAYRSFGFKSRPALRLTSFRLPFSGAWRSWLAGGASYGLMRMDALLVLALFGTGIASSGPPRLAVIFFVLSPTVRAGFEWAQLFYFDLKRLEVRPFGNLKARFERHVSRLAWILGMVFWAMACVVATAFYRHWLGDLYLLLLPFFVSRSLVAAAQIRAYSQEAFLDLTVSGLLITGGFVAVAMAADGERARVLLLAAAVLLGLAYLLGRRRAIDRRERNRQVLWFSEWLSELADVGGPVSVGVARFDASGDEPAQAPSTRWERENRWRHWRVARGMARRLDETGRVALAGDGRIAWFERRPGALQETWVLRTGAGMISSIDRTPVCPTGREALEKARDRALLLDPFPRRAPESEGNVEGSRRAFEAIVPGGLAFSPDESAVPALRSLSSADRRSVMLRAAQYARDLRVVGGRFSHEVTSLSVGGELRLIFLVNASTPADVRARWRRKVRRLNLEAAVSRPAVPGDDPRRPASSPAIPPR